MKRCLVIVCWLMVSELRAEPPVTFCHNCSQAEIEHWVRHYVAEPPLLQELVRQHVRALERAVYLDCNNAEARRAEEARLAAEAERSLPPNATLRERENLYPDLIEPDYILTEFFTRHQPFRNATRAYFRAARRYAAHEADLESYHQVSEQAHHLRRGGDPEELADAEQERDRLRLLLQDAGVENGNADLHAEIRAIEDSLLGIFPRTHFSYTATPARAQLRIQDVTLWQLARMRVALGEPIPPANRPLIICGKRDVVHYTRESAVTLQPPFLHVLTFNRLFLNSRLVPQED